MLQSIFDDVQRMNKRQVNEFLRSNYRRFLERAHMADKQALSPFTVPVSDVKFWYDRYICFDDMERLDGCNR